MTRLSPAAAAANHSSSSSSQYSNHSFQVLLQKGARCTKKNTSNIPVCLLLLLLPPHLPRRSWCCCCCCCCCGNPLAPSPRAEGPEVLLLPALHGRTGNATHTAGSFMPQWCCCNRGWSCHTAACCAWLPPTRVTVTLPYNPSNITGTATLMQLKSWAGRKLLRRAGASAP